MATDVMAPFPAQGYSDSSKEDERARFYQNIIRLRDQIVAGSHPRLSAKILDPRVDSFPSLPFPPIPPPPPPSSLKLQEIKASFPPATNGNLRDDRGFDQPRPSSAANGQQPAGSRQFHSQIDPIFLTKSDNLIKAEILIKRRQIESALKEQVDQRPKEPTQKSFTPDFDVTDVLRQAQARVKPATAQDESDPDTNSLDDDTFYSSVDNLSSPGTGGQSHQAVASDQTRRMDLDEAALSQQTVTQATEASKQAGNADTTRGGPSLVDAQIGARSPVARQDAFGRMVREPEPSNGDDLQGPKEQAIVPPGLSQTRNDMPSLRPNGEMEPDLFDPYVPSQPLISPGVPFIANRISSPVAPQPARISPLAVAKEPPYPQNNLRRRNASPAPDALPLSANQRRSSNDSPRHSNPRKKRRVVSEKGRKVSNRAPPESPDVFIKPEPESPPLLSAAPIPQPKRRQHPPNHTEPHTRRHHSPVSPRPRVGYGLPPRFEDDIRQPTRFIHAPPPQAEYVRIVREHDEPPRYVSNHVPQPISPYATRYPIPEQRQVRAVSQYIERPAMPRSGYYMDGPSDSRPQYVAMARPRSPIAASERYSPAPIRMSMAPPPVTRIAVDKYGREMMAADPPSIARHTPMPVSLRDSSVPQLRHRESESQPISFRVQSTAPYASYHEEPRYIEMLPARPMSSVRNIQDPGVTSLYRPREYSAIPIEVSTTAGVPPRPYPESRPHSPGPGREPSVLHRQRRPISPGYEGLSRDVSGKPPSARPEQGHRIYDQDLRVGGDRPDVVHGGPRDFVRDESGSGQFPPLSAPRYVLPPERIRYIEEPQYTERTREFPPDLYSHTVQMPARR